MESLLSLSSLLTIFIGIAGGYFVRVFIENKTIKNANERANQIIGDAEKDIETKRKEALLEAKDQLIQDKKEFERELKERRFEIQKLEKRVLKKEENLERKIETTEKKERKIETREKELNKREENIEKGELEQKVQLEKIAGLSRDQAKELILKEVEEKTEVEAQKYINKIEQESKLTAEKKARHMIVTAIQRVAPEITQEASISSVSLPSDEMKGRIIGREGRNIRALEVLTGVDIIIDDTPEAIVLSCFDPVRREKAKTSIERLISDGRIHPARIEEIVNKVSQEIEQKILEEGEKACFDLGIQGIAPELQRYIGRLKYRYSYGQNILTHSKEVASLCGLLASETGAEKDICIRGGLLHDIGKGVNTGEGEHALVGAEIAKKYGEDERIINSIASHHFDIEPASLEAIIVQTGDAISASRPGARRESFEDYIKRLTNLESIAGGFPGVEKAFAIQAGRELRIIVNNEVLDDVEAKKTAREIAKKIEEEMRYPGQVKVALIRETRVIEYAR